MPRKTPDEIFTVHRIYGIYEPDMDQITKALRIVLDIGAKQTQEKLEIPRNPENQEKAG